MKLTDWILDIIFPPRCVFCHRFTDRKSGGEKLICPECSSGIKVMEAADRKRTYLNITNCSSLFNYDGDVKESLHRFKFYGRAFYSSTYAKLISENITDEELKADIITWVPLSRQRKKERGYDQARLIAEELSRITGIPCRKTLKKIKNIAPQSQTGGAEARKANIAGVYRVTDRELIAGKTVLLVDDIVTTGSTLSECALMLAEGGAGEIKAVTVAAAKQN